MYCIAIAPITRIIEIEGSECARYQREPPSTAVSRGLPSAAPLCSEFAKLKTGAASLMADS